jgi:hypothetical protein
MIAMSALVAISSQQSKEMYYSSHDVRSGFCCGVLSMALLFDAPSMPAFLTPPPPLFLSAGRLESSLPTPMFPKPEVDSAAAAPGCSLPSFPFFVRGVIMLPTCVTEVARCNGCSDLQFSAPGGTFWGRDPSYGVLFEERWVTAVLPPAVASSW